MNNDQSKVVEVRRAFSQFPTSKEFYDFRNNLLSRSEDYWTIKAYQHHDDHEQSDTGIWALVIHENTDTAITDGTVIGYEEYSDFTETLEAANVGEKLTERAWQLMQHNHFQPTSD